MKIINKILIGSASALILFSGCTKDQLTAEPSGSTITKDQNDEVIDLLPNRAEALVEGMYAWFNQYYTVDPTFALGHDDFGYTSFCLSSELWGQDMVQTGSDYGWFWGDQIFTGRSYTAVGAFRHWNFFYKLNDKCNEVLRLVTPENEGDLAYSIAKAKTVRAFAYFNLVQIYQHTYKGHESAAGVPIVTEKTTNAEAANNPRAKVEDVYKFMLEDLADAKAKIAGYKRNTAKYQVDLNVVNGLLARVYLTMEKWSEAAAAADAAMAGYTPMSGAQYNDVTTGFNDISNSAWIWGSDVTEENRVVTSGIINYPSHYGSMNYGYVTAGAMFKAISKALYDMMPTDDIRRQSFVGADGKVTIYNRNLTLAPYANIKFKPYKGIYGNSTNANDWPLMRVEEMYLIKAEALAMGGDPAGGKAILENFVKTYRCPSYTTAAATATEVQEAVWIQRRLELWGEGLAWFDLKRLKKGVVRKYEGSNFDPLAAQINIPAEHGLFLWRIPIREIQSNIGIPESANNPDANTNGL